MAPILRPYPNNLWTPGQVKPQGPWKIDWTHPLTRGLVTYWIDTGSGFYIDLVSGNFTQATSLGGTTVPGRTVSPWGTGFSYTATLTEQADTSAARNQVWIAPYSCACGFFSLGASTGSNTGIFALADSSANDAFAFFYVTTSTVGISYGNVSSPFSFTPTAGTFYVVVGSATGTSTQSSWVNGVAQTAGSATSAYTGTSMYYIFNADESSYNSPGDAFMNGSCFFGAAWLGRSLSQADAALLYNDPYCFLVPSEGEMMALSSGAAPVVPLFAGSRKIFVPPRRKFYQ